MVFPMVGAEEIILFLNSYPLQRKMVTKKWISEMKMYWIRALKHTNGGFKNKDVLYSANK